MATTYRELTENYIATKSHTDYTRLYNRIKPGLTKYVANIIKDADIAEDIAVNTLIKMWTKIDQYDPQYQITTWLYRIAMNESLGYIRERNRTSSIDRMRDDFGVEVNGNGMLDSTSIQDLIEESDMKTEMDFYDEEEALTERYEIALDAIRNLKPLYREILVDRLINNMKYKDIAVKHNIKLQTVKNRIRRGRTLIQESVGELI
jgi:RNA polymerase sigma-70 factor (ECF subfamily)